MVYLIFDLEMPNPPSWNGRWGGEGRRHCLIKRFSDRYYKSIEHNLSAGSWTFRWDDGWTALITLTIADANHAQRVKKLSLDFSSYDWAVDSIIKYGKIVWPAK